ncbi:hypothetical protein Sste5346_001785 [Sporothrix stenoceras]|uniref:Uncharacterized protein n=1 Tax=Sporothrix stenoceras TaxID=5173 RepID=A0ABR3ZMT3_9PEZI
MDVPDEPGSEHGSIGDVDNSDTGVNFNDSPTLPFSFAVDAEEGQDSAGDEISHAEEVDAEEVSPEEVEDVDTNGGISNNDWHQPVSPLSSSPRSVHSETPLPKMKVTMSFMKAYKAMRGPRDVEPSPLFGCFIKSHQQKCNANSPRQETEDPFKLAGRDEVKLLNDVNDAIIRDCVEDKGKHKARPFVHDKIDDDEAGRQTVFYFEQPATLPLFPDESRGVPTNRHERKSSDGSDSTQEDDDSAIADHPLDHVKLDKGWMKANGPFKTEVEDSYVSDDDGDPAEVRISPAIFRALAAGCTVDNVDTLCQTVSEEEVSLRPLTPQDKIMKASMDTTHRNNVAPYCHRRQFDIHTGEELSPAYRIEPGSVGSLLWTPPGVTPERAGVYLLLLQEGQGEQQQPARGTGMPSLFQRMAPWDCQELRDRLYGGMQDDKSKSTSSSSLDGSSSGGSDCGDKKKRRLMTFTKSEVNEAVHNCHFDPEAVTLTPVDISHNRNGTGRAGPRHCNWRANSVRMAAGVATERALLQTFHDSWRTIQDGQAINASLVVANEETQAAITAQARCLASIEHQLEACRKAELARQLTDAQKHYQLQCEAERQAQRRRRRRERVVRGINEHLQSLRTTVGETKARLAQGRELKAVLAQRLRDGEARLERLCRDHSVANAADLSKVLTEQLACMGVKEDV